MPNEYVRIGGLLRTARKALGYTQLRVGNEIGVSEGTYSRYEAGKQKITIPELRAAARFLQVRIESLIDGGATTYADRSPTELARALLVSLERAESILDLDPELVDIARELGTLEAEQAPDARRRVRAEVRQLLSGNRHIS
jgi:transcriptional regulator with XRE-family HTH domain